jgi:hypothetical protein
MIDEIQKRVDAATPGPWESRVNGNTVRSYGIISPTRKICSSISTLTADAEFIAHARTDIPFLLSEVKRLESELCTQTEMADRAEKRAEADERAGILLLGIDLYEKEFPVLAMDKYRMHRKIIEVIDTYGINLFKSALGTASNKSPPPGNPLSYMRPIMEAEMEKELRADGLIE